MKKRSYYQVKAEKAKKEILDLISEVNDGFAEEAIGYKIGEVTVTLPENSTKNEVKEKLEKFMNDKVPR